MTELPKISIITVVYNAHEALERTILNVMALPYPNIDFLIIDGASTDGTVDLIRSYQDKLSYWVSEPDKGIYDAMNKGWSRADAESFVLFLGAGDMIEKLPDMGRFKSNDIIFGNVWIGDKWIFKSSVNFKSKIANTLHHQALLVRKSIHPAPPFNLSFKVYADFDFNQRLLKAGHNFAKDSEFLGYALEGGVSAKVDAGEYMRVVRQNQGLFVAFLGFAFYKLQQLNGYRKNIGSDGTV
jgi:glycosyltransferase involved in cell wall biosynthesis